MKDRFEFLKGQFTERERSLSVLHIAERDLLRGSVYGDDDDKEWREELSLEMFTSLPKLLDVIEGSYFRRYPDYDWQRLDLCYIFGSDKQARSWYQLSFKMNPQFGSMPQRELFIQSEFVKFNPLTSKNDLVVRSKEMIPWRKDFLDINFDDLVVDAMIGSGYGGHKQNEQVVKEDIKSNRRDMEMATLKLHPNAFSGLNDDEAVRLVNTMRRFWGKVFHPDHGGSEDIMKSINNSADFLEKPENRKI